MASLADELQADFLDLESDEENGVEENGEDGLNGDANGDAAMDDEENGAGVDDEEGDQKDKLDRAIDEAEDQSEAKERVDKINLRGVSDFKSIAQLWTKLRPVLEVSSTPKYTYDIKSKIHRSGIALTTLLQQIDEYQKLSPAEQAKKNLGKSDSPAYKLMNDANSLSTHIDSEIIVLHKWIRDHYSAFFAGLERLVENPVQYAKAVAIIGNGPMDAKAVGTTTDNVMGQSLDKVLEKALLMSVRMEAATTKTTPLPEPEIKMIFKACEMVLALDNAKEKIRAFVQDRMAEHCPNLTTLIGAETAASLVQACGGIQGLASKPAVNLGNLGWKPSRTGQATNAYGGGARQKGYIYHSPIVRNVPIDHRTQAIRIVAAKIALAARTDAVARTPDNSIGRQLAEDVARRLDVLTESAPNRGPRALPAPDDKRKFLHFPPLALICSLTFSQHHVNAAVNGLEQPKLAMLSQSSPRWQTASPLARKKPKLASGPATARRDSA
jgi:U4/U6 small nuclear ribonucleoprotein PRP31